MRAPQRWRGIEMSPKGNRKAIAPTCILELDDDILTVITSYLLELPSLADVRTVSVLCKRMRKISLSLIFRDVYWPGQNRTGFYPPALWPYIRCVLST